MREGGPMGCDVTNVTEKSKWELFSVSRLVGGCEYAEARFTDPIGAAALSHAGSLREILQSM